MGNGQQRWRAGIAAVVFACWAALGVRAQVVAGPATQPAMNLDEICRQLANADYSVREAGQKELERVPLDQKDAIARLGEAQKDPEVRTRLQQRVEEMEIYEAWHPPGVSLDADKATLAKVCDQLNAAMKMQVLASISGSREQTFALHATNQPFWEVFRQLNDQWPMTISQIMMQDGTRVRLSTLAGPKPTYQFADGFAISAQVMPQAVQANVIVMGNQLVAANHAAGTTIAVTAFADPRVRIGESSSILNLTSLTDDDGKSLMPLVAPSGNRQLLSRTPASSWTATALIRQLPAGVKKFSTIKGTITASAIASQQKIVIDDLEKRAFAPVETEAGTVTFTHVEARAGGGGFPQIVPAVNVRVVNANPVPLAGFGGGVPDPNAPAPMPITVTVSTPTRQVSTMTFTGAGAFAFLLDGNGPYRVELNVTRKMKSITLPVTFHDVPIP